MGSTHRANLILSGEKWGSKEMQERERYKEDLNNFLKSNGEPSSTRAAALAHFSMGYEDGYKGVEPFYNDEWDDI